MLKNLYRGVFVYRSTIERLYAYAYSKEQARLTMCRRLAKKHNIHPKEVFSKFNDDSNNFSIEPEIIFEEETRNGDRPEA